MLFLRWILNWDEYVSCVDGSLSEAASVALSEKTRLTASRKALRYSTANCLTTSSSSSLGNLKPSIVTTVMYREACRWPSLWREAWASHAFDLNIYHFFTCRNMFSSLWKHLTCFHPIRVKISSVWFILFLCCEISLERLYVWFQMECVNVTEQRQLKCLFLQFLFPY